MQLSPLQSRLAASLAASILLLTLYFVLLSPKFAMAADVSSIPDVFRDFSLLEEELERRAGDGPTYEPEFAAFDRSIMGRAPSDGVYSLTNNEAAQFILRPGMIAYFRFNVEGLLRRDESDSTPEIGSNGGASNAQPATVDGGADPGIEHEGHVRRQTSRTVFISANTCMQPQPAAGWASLPEPPQLSLYIPIDDNDQYPGPNKMSTSERTVFSEGAVMYRTEATKDVRFSIAAPNITGELTGVWDFEIAVSTDEWFHSYDDGAEDLVWIDSDANNVLLTTGTLEADDDQIQKMMQSAEMFADSDDSSRINGVRHSICGLRNYAQVKNTRWAKMVDTRTTKRGPGGLPQGQFRLGGLNSSTTYSGILVLPRAPAGLSKRQDGPSPQNSGGRVARQTQFQTKEGDNCKVITNLEFCNEIEYAVPANENKFNTTELARFYDDYAKTMYGNFEKVLAQIPCEAPASSRYSLARTCDDCKVAYKNWLCSVAIPRCEDFTSNNLDAHVRNVNQTFPNGTSLPDSVVEQFGRLGPAFRASRNPIIDERVAPGPYKEILPCEDLCYELVQSCPAAMEFSCPQPDNPQFSTSYGVRKGSGLSCNYPGSTHITSSSPARLPRLGATLALAAAVAAAFSS